MILNYIWVGFFLVALLIATFRLVVLGDGTIFTSLVTSTFDMSKTAFDIAIGLTGALSLWLGIMKVGEMGGAMNILARITRPFFRRLFPEVPAEHPAHGSILMNVAANMLGLDNAATPLGLKAMQELQDLNPQKDTATNAQIMFLVLNTSGLTIIPVSIMVYRAQLGAVNPTDVFLPILVATYFNSLIGLIAVAMMQRINLLQPVMLAYIGIGTALVGAIIYAFSGMTQEQVATASTLIANVILFGVISGFILLAAWRRINVFEAFIDGAKEGFGVAIRIIPYLVAILVAIGVFRASGALDLVVKGIGSVFAALGLPTDFIPALPTALMKPLSGSGARGLMVDTMKTYGADSFVGRLASTFQGTSDTTFYILALYFGSVGIRKTRHAVAGGLIADFAGIVAAILVAYLFWG